MADEALGNTDPLAGANLQGIFGEAASLYKESTGRMPRDRDVAESAAKAVESSDTDIQALHRQRISELEQQSSQMDSMASQMPQDQLKHVMAVSPLFMALAALAGGGGRTASISALGAMNGAVQGILKGDQQAYQQSLDKYHEQLESMQMKWTTRDKVYKELADAYGDDANGKLRRWQIANAAIGEDEKIATASFSKMAEIAKLQTTIGEKTSEYNLRKSYYDYLKGKAGGPGGKGAAAKPLTTPQKLAQKKFEMQVAALPMKEAQTELAAIKKQQDIIKAKYPPGTVKYDAADEHKLDELVGAGAAIEERIETAGQEALKKEQEIAAE